MKKILFLFFCIVTVCPLAAQPRITTITGEIKSMKEGIKVELYHNATYTHEAVAETKVSEGKFSFSIQLEEPRFFLIEAGPQFGNYSIVVGPGENLVLTGDSFHSVTFSGSDFQTEYYKKCVSPRQEHFSKVRALPEQQRPAMQEAYLKFMEKNIADNSNTFWGPILIYEYSGYIKPSEKIYDDLSENVKKSFYGLKLRERLNVLAINSINKPAPAFTTRDVNGKEYSLEALRKGHKYLLIDFWASWCGPCRKSMPEIKELAKKYAADGMTVVSISTDTKRDAWEKALKEEQMPWTNLLDDTGVIKKSYGVSSIPSVFLIGPDGKVVFEKLYGEALKTELKKVFGH